MVAVVRTLMVLLLHQVLIGGTFGLLPETGRRKHAGQTPGQSESLVKDFELRLLNMFGLRRRPTPSKTAIVPQYMLDLYHLHSENGDHGTKPVRNVMARHAAAAASRSNTIRSFHHEGKQLHHLYAHGHVTYMCFSLEIHIYIILHVDIRQSIT